MSPESGSTKDEADRGLQINVDEEEFILPPAGEMEQDILRELGEDGGGSCFGEKGVLSPTLA